MTYIDGTTIRVSEQFLWENFSDQYVDELKKRCHQQKYVDIPVGYFKRSHLYRYPQLRCIGAPSVRFVQEHNQDLCVSNSLASAFYNVGFHDEATKIAMFGQRKLAGGTVNALEKVVSYATCKANNVLPSWIQPKMKPLRFDWHDLVEDQRTVFLGVLFSSDGNSSHAVAIHGGFIYDANEVVALPLCKDALDYCTSTEQKRSKFVEFRRGYLFRYMGQKPKFIHKMTLRV